ncbi:hypothetical protein EOI87_09905 [Salmonella enterica]|nr:hypothetical protein [Salmonella enterica]
MSDQIRQLKNAQKLNALINALRFSWTELYGEDVGTLMDMAYEYSESIKSWLTNKAEGEKSDNNQKGTL